MTCLEKKLLKTIETLDRLLRHIKMISAPAAERNKESILNVLKQVLNTCEPLQGLEIASGTGQHVSLFAKHFQNITWTPSDVDKRYLGSISSYIDAENLQNVQEPILLDVTTNPEHLPGSLSTTIFDFIYCANMIHITPFPCTLGLFNVAGKLLKKSSGLLITYGPYAEGGNLVPESNIRFDEGLKQQNPEWGVRDIDDLVRIAAENGLKLIQRFEMPANNKILIFKKE